MGIWARAIHRKMHARADNLCLPVGSSLARLPLLLLQRFNRGDLEKAKSHPYAIRFYRALRAGQPYNDLAEVWCRHRCGQLETCVCIVTPTLRQGSPVAFHAVHTRAVAADCTLPRTFLGSLSRMFSLCDPYWTAVAPPS